MPVRTQFFGFLRELVNHVKKVCLQQVACLQSYLPSSLARIKFGSGGLADVTGLLDSSLVLAIWCAGEAAGRRL